MAITRYPVSKYASVELNQVAFDKEGKIISQTPLGTEFTTAAPCENGMWVEFGTATGKVHTGAAVTVPYGIVYSAEKEYTINDIGLKSHYKVAGDYPRVGRLSIGDKITTNCLCYDSTEYATETALHTALNACATTAVYVIPVASSGVPKLTATAPASGAYGRVVKEYTMPNGESGVKYEIIRA